ncbi:MULTISPECIES: 2-oxoacid:acceptor oxidoreductase family protein [unclassified Methanoculleus]|uniref:2-oxoacid:acceptor oxidoreductase family protein n=1 Tax=unclassified Methanoculleus TaxID=2619537 RepID=UPI0025DBDCA9|nr:MULTISPECIES: 2-oxoacid:acceptor oxidoreductase family protein [unclassified Methanoculleus]
MYEIRIHSRGGQGGVTAAKLLALAAFRDGKHATACPFYGAERRGAPVVSFVRIDDQPIKVYSQIHEPDLVIVLDTSIMDVVDVLQGLKDGGTVLLNSAHPVAGCNGTCRHVDLTGIALAQNLVVAGSPILNTPVLGALAKMDIVTLPSALQAIREMFADERNVKAAEAAYEELKV